MDTILTRNDEFFTRGGKVFQIETCLHNLKKITIGYSQQYPADKSLEEELKRCEDQWSTTINRIETFRNQLQQIPAKWDCYKKKFVEMEQWMDHVDETMGNIVKEVNSSEEFEKEKAIFQVYIYIFM